MARKYVLVAAFCTVVFGAVTPLERPVFELACQAALVRYLNTQTSQPCISVLVNTLIDTSSLLACTDAGVCLRRDLISSSGLWGGDHKPTNSTVKISSYDDSRSTGTDKDSNTVESFVADALTGEVQSRQLRAPVTLLARHSTGLQSNHHVRPETKGRLLALSDLLPPIPVDKCPLCALNSSTGGRTPCRRILSAFLNQAQSAGNRPATIENVEACADPLQLASLALLRDQPEIMCNRAVGHFSPTPGQYKAHTLTQCRGCAVMPCTAGMVCRANAMPQMCPPGRRCPDGLASLPFLNTSQPVPSDATAGRIALLSAEITDCPAGFACPGGGHPAYPCSDGDLCPTGSSRPVRVLPVVVVAAVLCALNACAIIGWCGEIIGCGGGQCGHRSKRAQAQTTRRVCSLKDDERGASWLACCRPRQGAQSACCCRPNQEQGRASGNGYPESGNGYLPVLIFKDLHIASRGGRGRRTGRSTANNPSRTPLPAPPARLSGVSGVILPGRVTALIGPSGAGKSTLLRALLGQEKLSRGSVTVGLAPASSVEVLAGAGADHNPLQYHPTSTQSSSLLSWAVGLVPQDDREGLVAELSVRETLVHAARARLPSRVSSASVHARVDALLQDLGLQGLAGSRVGDVRDRGISGGEGKRLAIGVELASDPLLLCCDEPTTGLDASSSMGVARLLRRVARKRLIPVLVILHTPRAEVWDCVDDVILLAQGGAPVYVGPKDGLVPFLSTLCAFPAPGFNHADWALDVLERGWPLRVSPTASGEQVEGSRVHVHTTTKLHPRLALPPHRDSSASSSDPCVTGNIKTCPADGDPQNDSRDSALSVGSVSEASIGTMGGGTGCAPPPASTFTAPPSALLPFAPKIQSKTVHARSRSAAAVAATALVEAWRARELLLPVRAQAVAASGNIDPACESVDGGSILYRIRNERARPAFMYQLCVHARRAAIQRYRSSSVAVDVFSLSLAGAVVGIACVGGPLFLPPPPMTYFDSCPYPSRVLCNWAQRWMIGPGAFFISIVLGSMTIPPSVRIFGAHASVLRRENVMGLHVPAYILGKVLPEAPLLLLLSACFTAMLSLIAPWRAPWLLLWLTCMGEMAAVGAVGMLLSVLLPSQDSANLTGVVLTGVTLNLFGGFVPVIGKAAYWAYPRYAQRAIVALEVLYGVGLPSYMFPYFVPAEWQNPSPGRDLAMLFAFAGVTLVVTNIAIIVKLRCCRG